MDIVLYWPFPVPKSGKMHGTPFQTMGHVQRTPLYFETHQHDSLNLSNCYTMTPHGGFWAHEQ